MNKLLTLICLCLFIVTGCSKTSRLWDTPEYFESIDSFSISEQNNLLIVAGERHAYLFDISEPLEKTLNLSRSINFTPSFSAFDLSTTGELTGDLTLSIDSSTLADATRSTLVELGFSSGQTMTVTHALHGKRYALEKNENSIKLEHKYSVLVREEEGVMTNAGKVALTPGTLVIDSALVVPTTALWVGLAIYMSSNQH